MTRNALIHCGVRLVMNKKCNWLSAVLSLLHLNECRHYLREADTNLCAEWCEFVDVESSETLEESALIFHRWWNARKQYDHRSLCIHMRVCEHEGLGRARRLHSTMPRLILISRLIFFPFIENILFDSSNLFQKKNSVRSTAILMMGHLGMGMRWQLDFMHLFYCLFRVFELSWMFVVIAFSFSCVKFLNPFFPSSPYAGAAPL